MAKYSHKQPSHITYKHTSRGWGGAEPRWTSGLSFSVKEPMARSDVSQEMKAQGTETRKRVSTQALHSPGEMPYPLSKRGRQVWGTSDV